MRPSRKSTIAVSCLVWALSACRAKTPVADLAVTASDEQAAVIELGFPDTAGLIEALSRRLDMDAQLSDEGLSDPEDAMAVWIGAALPLEAVKPVLVEALSRYDHLQYFHLTSDHWRVPDWFHHMLFLGGLTESAETLELNAVPSATMLQRLEMVETVEELHDLVRSFYSGAFRTWPVP